MRIVPKLIVVLLVLSEGSQAKSLYAFPGKGSGALPWYAGVVSDASGNLYGTTNLKSGNGYDQKRLGYGTVYRLDTAGNETVLHTFTGRADGAYPSAGVIVDTQGNLYGTTRFGGNLAANCVLSAAEGCGVVFKVDAKGVETVLHTFQAGEDGEEPVTSLVLDASGNLYGTALYGGNRSTPLCSNQDLEDGCGVVFKIDGNANFSVLHDFRGRDGANPWAPLILDGSGSLYGTTNSGGDINSTRCGPIGGCGVVFKMDSRSGEETVLHRFTNTDGSLPWGPVLLDHAGNVYGTTWGGGDYRYCPGYGCGTAFTIDAVTDVLSVLHTFGASGYADGQHPQGNLLMDHSGNLYGIASSGGSSGDGAAYKLDGAGNETILKTFHSEMWDPTGYIIFDAHRKHLIGTTVYGGDNETCNSSSGCGTVFRIAP